MGGAISFRYAGFDIMGLNNNHLTDFQEKPINFTISLLKKVGIKTFGYTYGTVEENRPQVYSDIYAHTLSSVFKCHPL